MAFMVYTSVMEDIHQPCQLHLEQAGLGILIRALFGLHFASFLRQKNEILQKIIATSLGFSALFLRILQIYGISQGRLLYCARRER